jgi:hypothetical protein
MVKVSYRIVITGMICLTVIYVALLVFDKPSPLIGECIIACIALSIGIILPAPKIDNRRGVLKW